MPRPLSEYSFADWRRLRPVLHQWKSLRYRMIDAGYARRPPRPSGDVPAMIGQLRGRKVLTTIAYGDAEAIEWQAVLLRRYLPEIAHVIADNTPDSDPAAAAVVATARRLGLLHVALPANPWRAGSRSHGIALNWVWRNLILPSEPEAFGFLDDDIFPTSQDDPFAPLATQDFYGVIREAGARWFLWAGFCTFRFAGVKDKPLDFSQDWFAGLDTGGANWDVLYRSFSRETLKEAPTVFVPYRSGVTVADGPLQWVGPWLHEIGATGDPALQADKRRQVARILAPHLAAVE